MHKLHVFLKILSYFFYLRNYKAYFLLLCVVISNIGIVFFNLDLNRLYGIFFDALHDKNTKMFYENLWPIIAVTVSIVVSFTISYWTGRVFMINWRKATTEKFSNLYLKHNNLYALTLDIEGVDNPDQRIANDLTDALEKIFHLATGIITQLVTVSTYMEILWLLSPTIKFSSVNIKIEGIFVWAAILYAISGTAITILFGRKLSLLKRLREKVDADFRRTLISAQNDALEITLSKGQSYIYKALDNNFREIIANYYKIIKVNLPIGLVNSLYNTMKKFSTIIIAAPFYLANTISFGDMMRIPGAFGSLNNAFSFIIVQYQNITTFIASMNRIIELHQTLETIPSTYHNQDAHFNNDDAIIVHDMNIFMPDSSLILENINIQILSREKLLIIGDVGIGKTAFLKTIMGLWPYYSGTINVSKDIFILPQKQQIFRGKLIDSIIYPDTLRDEYKTKIHKIFDYLDMNNFKSKLFMEGDWDKILSGGEKQIISIIRAIYHAPKVMILDEPTSALDQKTASILFTKMLEVLHDSTIITISHDLKLKKFHDTVVDFKKFKVNSMAPKH